MTAARKIATSVAGEEKRVEEVKRALKGMKSSAEEWGRRQMKSVRSVEGVLEGGE